MKKPNRIATLSIILVGFGFAAWRTRARDPRASEEALPAVEEASPAPSQAAPAQTAEEAISAHAAASRGPEQPIPFNHRFHTTELQLDCMYCHTGTERSSMGLVPSLEVCYGCHRVAGSGLEPIDELRDYWTRRESIPWQWVNKLPDFVQFNHQPHLRNRIECQKCHGPVEDMDRVYQWAPFTMGWCLACHRSEPEEGDVATDYRLVAGHPAPTSPVGRQDKSLYPIAIDQKYGAYRAPIDCTVCHY